MRHLWGVWSRFLKFVCAHFEPREGRPDERGYLFRMKKIIDQPVQKVRNEAEREAESRPANGIFRSVSENFKTRFDTRNRQP